MSTTKVPPSVKGLACLHTRGNETGNKGSNMRTSTAGVQKQHRAGGVFRDGVR